MMVSYHLRDMTLKIKPLDKHIISNITLIQTTCILDVLKVFLSLETFFGLQRLQILSSKRNVFPPPLWFKDYMMLLKDNIKDTLLNQTKVLITTSSFVQLNLLTKHNCF